MLIQRLQLNVSRVLLYWAALRKRTLCITHNAPLGSVNAGELTHLYCLLITEHDVPIGVFVVNRFMYMREYRE